MFLNRFHVFGLQTGFDGCLLATSFFLLIINSQFEPVVIPLLEVLLSKLI